MNKKKRRLLFISHAEKDSEIVSEFVDLLYNIGLRTEDMFCSSRTDLDIAIGEDIYDYLRKTLDLDDVITVFMLSDNYSKNTKKHIQNCEQELISISAQITLCFQLVVFLSLLIF